jgi:ribonuclease HII
MTTIRVTTPDLRQERSLARDGHVWVAGLDEVGRGAWAGPVSVGAAVMKPRVTKASIPAWLRDSKQLSEDRRESIFEPVGRWCADWAVGHASPEECDELGMTAALRLASVRALAGLRQPPDAILVDGPRDLLRGPEGSAQAYEGTVRPVIGGDARCASVAAASVLAKVVRDRMMRTESEHFPAYAFERNKGYPSPLHQTALRGYGLSSIHRRSWSFVEDLPWTGARWTGPKRACDLLGLAAEAE